MHTCFHPDLQVGVSLLSEEQALHVVRVLRMTEGQTVRLIDGVGGEAVGTLTAVGKRKASVHVEHVDMEEARPPGLTLVVAPTKSSDRFEWLLEKATELGVEEVIPVWTQRSERRVDKRERWRKVVVAATKQSNRTWMPMLHPACALEQVFDAHPQLTSRAGAVAHCMTACENTPKRVAWPLWQEGQNHAWIAIGPEGDFTAEEVQWMTSQAATPVHLGELRLRTETAGMAAVAQFM